MRLLPLLAALVFAISCTTKPALSRPVAAPSPPPLLALDPSMFPAPAWAFVSKAELDKYGTVYAISDVHGAKTKLIRLLKANGLVKSVGGKTNWTGEANGKVLLVFVGDYIDKNEEDGAGLLMLIESLQKEAAARGDRVIATLGNHEAEYFFAPGDCKKTFRESVRDYVKNPDLKCKEIVNTPVGRFMKTLPIGAVLDRWMLVHSGLIGIKPVASAETNRDLARGFFAEMTSQYAKGDFSSLGGKARSILTAHDWIPWNHNAVRVMYAAIGIDKLIVGHEPKVLNVSGEIAISSNQWLIKLDAGMNAEAEDSEGRLLRCRPPAMNCDQLDEKGKATPLAQGTWVESE